MEQILNDKIAAIIEPSLKEMGYALVQIRFIENASHTLQIMAERIDEKNMTVEDCANISHTVSALMDVEDPITSAYTLEISSPGIDRPLVKITDFEKFSGYEVKLETKLAVNGQKRFKGRLTGVHEKDVLLKTETGDVILPFGNIRTAKLLLTDELLKKAQMA